ncbi:Ricin-type beta-trefoil lectin domain-like [Actinacidiphila guanduensis]|uniref:Ricin-type beta-trefoil lectin domain-like n=1 Tax=Actinacidiphila guanduensis TaxID=310781 RepID=A0A1G9V181_9ACTN|nr:Ricin-type beta-trefoil lectin domain-like [Actinacidiphila guanduensis]
MVASAAQRGFQDRPVVGGMFAPLLPPAGSTVHWFRIQNRNSGKVLAVSGMSQADAAQVTQWSDNGTADHLWRFI